MGMVCVISRGCGVTKLTSAIIAPQTRATITLTTTRKRMRLGKESTRLG